MHEDLTNIHLTMFNIIFFNLNCKSKDKPKLDTLLTAFKRLYYNYN